MHRALYVAEIARLVCDNANQSSLVALARCCSALHQEAMTALWKKLDTLAPLVSTLPSDCWVIEKREQVNYSAVSSRVVAADVHAPVRDSHVL